MVYYLIEYWPRPRHDAPTQKRKTKARTYNISYIFFFDRGKSFILFQVGTLSQTSKQTENSFVQVKQLKLHEFTTTLNWTDVELDTDNVTVGLSNIIIALYNI